MSGFFSWLAGSNNSSDNTFVAVSSNNTSTIDAEIKQKLKLKQDAIEDDNLELALKYKNEIAELQQRSQQEQPAPSTTNNDDISTLCNAMHTSSPFKKKAPNATERSPMKSPALQPRTKMRKTDNHVPSYNERGDIANEDYLTDAHHAIPKIKRQSVPSGSLFIGEDTSNIQSADHKDIDVSFFNRDDLIAAIGIDAVVKREKANHTSAHNDNWHTWDFNPMQGASTSSNRRGQTKQAGNENKNQNSSNSS
jgi:hypothetical protein